MSEATVAALEPLFGPADVPDRHRTRAKIEGSPAQIVPGRRPTRTEVVQNLRRQVNAWRISEYAGVSSTSRELLFYWFGEDHDTQRGDDEISPFAYYFCQREAIETLIYLYESREIRTVSGTLAEFGGEDSARLALGISPDEDAWARYAFKIATGAGKTKVMSLAIVWSYFHALREPESTLAKDFVVIAPGVTVFERLKEDFRPQGGGNNIFDADPLIPVSWRSDWAMSVVLQTEPTSASAGGTIYLTNIHRLYDTSTRRSGKAPDEYDWMGPSVAREKAFDLSAELRDRIAAHPRLMVLNDEAHHVWDPGSAWTEALRYLHNKTRERGGGLVAQLDFSATPKDNTGRVFKHVIVDTPLGEAVDAGIVKTPIIGRGERLTPRPHGDAGYKYEHHLTLAYKRWQASRAEWEKSGKKPLMFVMTESTEAADQITRRLNSDRVFEDLNGRTINLHTNLKGKLKKRGSGVTAYYEFIESEKEISEDDLEQLRALSRELDLNTSPYRCIVSVLMLREGWDVRNVTTIVPLRPLTSKSRILPEQTLGRGLRRMTPPGLDQPAETVTVVEHKAFASLYQDELAEEGVHVPIVDLQKVPSTTVSIYPDADNKDVEALDLEIPRLTYGYRTVADLADLSFEDVRRAYADLAPLPLGKVRQKDIRYEGRHLITNEVLQQMRIKLPLLSDPVGAISFYREELERAVKIRGTHAQLAPLLQRFIEELLFEQRVALYDARVVGRLADGDVQEYVRATFLPLLLKKLIQRQERVVNDAPQSVSRWRPYQVTHSETRPTELADRTPFNLVPCNRQLEVAMTHFLDRCGDVAAFAKNQGPQAVRIDCLNADGRRALYTPDFLIRRIDGHYVLAETKGRADRDVSGKARGAVEWCKAASTSTVRWSYLYIPQSVFQAFGGETLGELVRACEPALKSLLKEAESRQLALPLTSADEESALIGLRNFVTQTELATLPSRSRIAVEHAVLLFDFMANKEKVGFPPVFQPLLGPIDSAAESILISRLADKIPTDTGGQETFFNPDLSNVKTKHREFLINQLSLLKRLLLHHSPIMPTGLLRFCIEYAKRDDVAPPGVLATVRRRFVDLTTLDLSDLLAYVYNFRNTYVAHAKLDLTDRNEAEAGLRKWIKLLLELNHVAIPEPALGS